MAHENKPTSAKTSNKAEADKAEELEVAEEIHETAESETPTSNDVGKQTLTKADMGGRDVTVDGVPEEELATPRHPDDPSGD
jgi:hypothetical protein